jgi:hypothetical protein
LLQHNFEQARELYGDRWLGFAESDLQGWLEAAGFKKIEVSVVGPRRTAAAFPDRAGGGREHDKLGLSIGRNDQLLAFRQTINQLSIPVKLADRNRLHNMVNRFASLSLNQYTRDLRGRKKIQHDSRIQWDCNTRLEVACRSWCCGNRETKLHDIT